MRETFDRWFRRAPEATAAVVLPSIESIGVAVGGVTGAVHDADATTAIRSASSAPRGRRKGGDAMLASLAKIAEAWPQSANASLKDSITSKRLREWLDPATGVDGFHFGGQAWVTSLPEGLRVSGSLELNGCVGLTTLPKGLLVDGDLDLEGCIWLMGLPEGLVVAGHLICPTADMAALAERLRSEGLILVDGEVRVAA